MTRVCFVLLGALWAIPASAATYYIDSACPTSGNGTTDVCGGTNGRINSSFGLQSLLASTTLKADDFVVIHTGNGKYVSTNNGGDPSESGGFTFGTSGTAGHPITVTSAPGETVVIANCATQNSYCVRPTFTNNNRQYIRITSLNIEGGIWTMGSSTAPDAGAKGLEFDHLDISTGWGEVNDGNWAAIFLNSTDDAKIHHNYIHDIFVPSGGGRQDSGVGIKSYYNSDAVIELNTITRVNIPESQVEGIDLKAHDVRNIVRFNDISGVTTCVRLNSQSTAMAATGVQVYGNVCRGDPGTPRTCFRFTLYVNDALYYNNTCYGFASGVLTENGPLTNVKMYDNIFHGNTDRQVEAYVALFTAPTDYNAWTAGQDWMYPGRSAATLAGWQSSGFDTHSHTTGCTFTAPPGDLTLVSGPCKTGGKVGGVATGTTIEQGAYGVTPCVGYTCGSAIQPPPTCTFTLAPGTVSVPETAGSTTLTLTASATTCAWTANASQIWLTVSPASGTGSNTLTVSYVSNSGTSRAANVSVGSAVSTINQAAATVTPPPTIPTIPDTCSVVQTVLDSAGVASSTVAEIPCPAAATRTPQSLLKKEAASGVGALRLAGGIGASFLLGMLVAWFWLNRTERPEP